MVYCYLCRKDMDSMDEAYVCMNAIGTSIFLCRECFYALAVLGLVRDFEDDKWLMSPDVEKLISSSSSK